ncbi:hypothetical protein [Fodinicola feengrottensis]|uniref:Uncharacterized protein n=1 Tax=Fodinicola feengrottensis TaxID=435914 RepID=A0ABN2JBG6_9ACTN|nr:hypothetical protein [Fodinicola feengrottensis]
MTPEPARNRLLLNAILFSALAIVWVLLSLTLASTTLSMILTWAGAVLCAIAAAVFWLRYLR